MQPMERIEVGKIYVGSAAKFGLLYGLVIGIIMAIVALVGDILGFANYDLVSNLIPFGSIYIGALVILVFFVVAGLVTMVVTSLIYNLIAELGGRLHLGLAEYVKPIKPVKSVQNKPNVKLGTSARTNKKSGNNIAALRR